LKYVDRGVIADLHLIVAKLLWEQKRFARSFVAIGYSVIAWPAVTVRLGEAILRRLRTA